MVKKRELRICLWLLLAMVLTIVSISFLATTKAGNNTQKLWMKKVALYRQDPYQNTDDPTAISTQIQQELKHVPYDTKYQNLITFENSFGADRNTNANYSENATRIHEGCDLMYQNNKRGEVPVCSMTDGVIEQIGWLTLGGWRIGIRSDAGYYYYYAHLYSYASELKVGKRIVAGEFLGFMGDTGYGEEGTYGKFPVHLHLGIYVPKLQPKDVNIKDYVWKYNFFFQVPQKSLEMDEISINPYPFLKQMQD